MHIYKTAYLGSSCPVQEVGDCFCLSSCKAVLSVAKMNFGSSSLGSATRGRRTFAYGRTYIVRPKGRHQATIVWLHGLGDNGSSWAQLFDSLPLSNIKWICATAPSRPVAALGGFPCTAWFNVVDLSDDGPDDVEGLENTAAHVANLLSAEPAGIKLGIGGFSMGAAAALYSATCFVRGNYGNGTIYPINLRAIVALSGWLPFARTLRNRVVASQVASRRAASLPVLLCHGREDDVVQYNRGQRSAEVLVSSGFRNLAFKSFNGVGHFTVPEEMKDVSKWLSSNLGLDGSRSLFGF